ncbi:nitroreductase family protein [Alkalicella caledoniensis]|uniref:Nitroreductase family protein n=1 Tax=Alkalicella caledoniensis TaxID=2731377 RepID=A0A7G9WAS1_ALKCA|nr:nitroreductase family protein [Alkalicella caledoniensis]QNO15783.1 nitroreductase family protein [Alkalicella caledoniensis]
MLNTLIKRRSIRKYKTQKIEQEKIDVLVQAALLSPSSRSIRPWEFIIVQEPQTLQKLSEAKTHGASFLKDAPLAFVVLGDSSKSDVWVEDTSIASIIIQLTAEQMNLGSCWIQIRNRQNQETTAESYIQNLLNIPEHLKVEAIISLGYPDEQKQPYELDKLPYEKVKQETYN